MKTVKPSDRHEELRLAIVEAMKPFQDIPNLEQLAVLSVFLGQMIALQDSTKHSAERIMSLVAGNIELGNANALTAVAMGIIKP
jgi:hypothetical protein